MFSPETLYLEQYIYEIRSKSNNLWEKANADEEGLLRKLGEIAFLAVEPYQFCFIISSYRRLLEDFCWLVEAAVSP